MICGSQKALEVAIHNPTKHLLANSLAQFGLAAPFPFLDVLASPWSPTKSKNKGMRHTCLNNHSSTHHNSESGLAERLKGHHRLKTIIIVMAYFNIITQSYLNISIIISTFLLFNQYLRPFQLLGSGTSQSLPFQLPGQRNSTCLRSGWN